jgi:DNA-binding winged helix-turn-helix (wHTH) protein/Tfp pilus assembly protein PilF
MANPKTNEGLFRFGVFEVSTAAREISRRGHRIKLQDQPFELLLLLLERPGEIVDREEIRRRLWPEDTFVDFGQSLSTAVTKLRQALGDDASNPRFIETIPRHGYRFIAPVTLPDSHPQDYLSTPLPLLQPQAEVQEQVKSRPNSAWIRRPIVLFATMLALVGTGIFGSIWYERKSAFALAPKDTVILADFENSTGETIFNDTLRQALIVGLAQSPVLNVLSDRNAAVVFKQMGHSPDDRMTGMTAVNLCRRVGAKVAVQGSISNLGTTYLVGLAAIRCDTAKPIANEQVEAQQRSDVIDALGKAASKLRRQLGESLPSIQKYNAPLEQATTSSLDALNAYSQALSTWDAKGDIASLPYFKRAIDLDPDFAMAYGGLATVYNNLGKPDLARESTIKAFNLRARVTESERASIEARYYLYVTEEVEKAEQTYAALAKDYPESAGSLNHLGTTDLRLGRNQQAVDDFRRAMLLDPTRAISYGNLALSLLRLDRIQEAEAVLADADKRGLRTGYWLRVNYWIAFLNGKQGEMNHFVQQSTEITGARPTLLAEQAETEASSGHFKTALSLSESAVELLLKGGDKESAASVLAQAAVREALVGNKGKARALIKRASTMSSNKSIVTSGALIAALAGDDSRASALSKSLERQYPNGTFIQRYWLPVIRAEIELSHKQAANALTLLKATDTLDPSVADGFFSPLFPAFVRGQAYLAANDGLKANDEFQSLIEHRGMVLNSPIGTLALLGHARALASAGRTAEAQRAFQRFFARWKDADPGIPLVHQARAEAVQANRTR